MIRIMLLRKWKSRVEWVRISFSILRRKIENYKKISFPAKIPVVPNNMVTKEEMRMACYPTGKMCQFSSGYRGFDHGHATFSHARALSPHPRSPSLIRGLSLLTSLAVTIALDRCQDCASIIIFRMCSRLFVITKLKHSKGNFFS